MGSEFRLLDATMPNVPASSGRVVNCGLSVNAASDRLRATPPGR
jgi:hypothetical protein